MEAEAPSIPRCLRCRKIRGHQLQRCMRRKRYPCPAPKWLSDTLTDNAEWSSSHARMKVASRCSERDPGAKPRLRHIMQRGAEAGSPVVALVPRPRGLWVLRFWKNPHTRHAPIRHHFSSMGSALQSPTMQAGDHHAGWILPSRNRTLLWNWALSPSEGIFSLASPSVRHSQLSAHTGANTQAPTLVIQPAPMTVLRP